MQPVLEDDPLLYEMDDDSDFDDDNDVPSASLTTEELLRKLDAAEKR